MTLALPLKVLPFVEPDSFVLNAMFHCVKSHASMNTTRKIFLKTRWKIAHDVLSNLHYSLAGCWN
jgi:hypothetical protein